MSRARDELSELVDKVAFGGERVVLTRYGRPVAIIVPVSETALAEVDGVPVVESEAS